MRVEIIFHSEQLKQQLRQVSDRLTTGRSRHILAAMVQAARTYMLFIWGRFFRASRHDGTWKDHAPSTKLKKARKFAPSVLRSRAQASTETSGAARLADAVSGLKFPILYETGRLFRSMSPGGPGYLERVVNPLHIKVGTSVPYAAPHQDGAPSRNLPQRVILAAPDAQTVKQMETIITAGVEREVAEVNAQFATR